MRVSSSLFFRLFRPPLGHSRPTKNNQKNCKMGRAKTALIERFEGVKLHFRHRSLFRLVRALRLCFFFSLFHCPKHFLVVPASSSLFSRLFCPSLLCFRTIWISQRSSIEVVFLCDLDVRKRRILDRGHVFVRFNDYPWERRSH